MKIRNLTPHPVVIATPEGELAIPSEGIARVSTTEEVVGTLAYQGHSVPLVIQSFGEVEGLPEASPDTMIIVSGVVRAALPGRPDLVSPARLVRDERGRVQGCQALTRS